MSVSDQWIASILDRAERSGEILPGSADEITRNIKNDRANGKVGGGVGTAIKMILDPKSIYRNPEFKAPDADASPLRRVLNRMPVLSHSVHGLYQHWALDMAKLTADDPDPPADMDPDELRAYREVAAERKDDAIAVIANEVFARLSGGYKYRSDLREEVRPEEDPRVLATRKVLDQLRWDGAIARGADLETLADKWGREIGRNPPHEIARIVADRLQRRPDLLSDPSWTPNLRDPIFAPEDDSSEKPETALLDMTASW